MKKVFLPAMAAVALTFGSCTVKQFDNSKNSVAFPGMTVTRADYKLSKDVTGEVEVKEWSTLFGLLHGPAKLNAVGEDKNKLRQGIVSGINLGLTPGGKIAVYRLLEANPNFDYLTNIRVQKEYTKKWAFLFTKYNTVYKVTAKGITLNTEK